MLRVRALWGLPRARIPVRHHGGTGRGGDDRLAGMGDIVSALGVRGFAAYRVGPTDFTASAIGTLPISGG